MVSLLHHRVLPKLTVMAALAFLASTPRSCHADDQGFLEEIQDAAKQVLSLVKGQAVSIGQITPNDPPEANGGPVIAEALKAALERLQPGIVKSRGAPFAVKGDFGFAPHPTEQA